MYSAISHKSVSLVTDAADDTVGCKHIPQFWLGMLAGRDDTDMVNLTPCMEEFTVPQPVARRHGKVALGSTLVIDLPFLTNSRTLEPGELLVLPFDGGLSAMCIDKFPPM